MARVPGYKLQVSYASECRAVGDRGVQKHAGGPRVGCERATRPRRECIRALRHASTELRADREVVLLAVGLSETPNALDSDCRTGERGEVGRALRFAARELREDREVVLAAVHPEVYPSSS